MLPRVNSAAIRRLNMVRVFHALRENPNCAQRDLSRLTGLDKATTSAIVAQMIEDGLVERSDAPRARRIGRPETALGIAPSAGLLVGARLEPGTIRIVSTTLAGTVVEQSQLPGSTDLATALRHLHEGIDAVVAASRLEGGAAPPPLRGIGIGIPALMDRAGRLVLAPNLGWRDTPIRPLLEEALGAPVHVDNDTKAAAMAERLFGACRGVEDFVYLTGHSGVGGGLFLGGRLYRGAQGFAGEIGHLTVVPGGRPCGCGKRGCLETYVSETSILAQAGERGRALPDLWAAAAAARDGDPVVRTLLEAAGSHLGVALSHMVNLMNPGLVVLGGNLSIVAEFVLPTLNAALDEHALGPLRRDLRLLVSPLGPDAVPMGGIALAMDGFLSVPGPIL
ncbi:ROK family transcriptional regulator (plasmid) [Azospirillum brasilense]|uniref:ROK family transcriptional regulator n=1 Tax=Azospirillum brasilense TaxID=192 RepID=A0A4D8QP14_AZOBR|nr:MULTISPECIES: ROK family transcriptional regulator [Azospirillum]MDW7554432.1 ROK family transcriptional regulator [Azospirillum brasilense]MDW7594049.1 ROK family transcriptional regulator [Azospirillum brasilense]MDW7631679.1 ROK family transcriptional regulator [Azospirillum brasilense]MDX5949981.1 ROK family transcriptional regulator [Azospirillum brasilense]NUB25715.1 ROK family protein [Azospirillum brasilense]